QPPPGQVCALAGLKELRMLATGVDCAAKKRRCVKNSAAGGGSSSSSATSAATPVRFGLLMLPQDLTALMSEDIADAAAAATERQARGECGKDNAR
ncbi:hypothetical protein KR222_005532, partial [Zaprionus bogoriensis]